MLSLCSWRVQSWCLGKNRPRTFTIKHGSVLPHWSPLQILIFGYLSSEVLFHYTASLVPWWIQSCNKIILCSNPLAVMTKGTQGLTARSWAVAVLQPACGIQPVTLQIRSLNQSLFFACSSKQWCGRTLSGQGQLMLSLTISGHSWRDNTALGLSLKSSTGVLTSFWGKVGGWGGRNRYLHCALPFVSNLFNLLV